MDPSHSEANIRLRRSAQLKVHVEAMYRESCGYRRRSIIHARIIELPATSRLWVRPENFVEHFAELNDSRESREYAIMQFLFRSEMIAPRTVNLEGTLGNHHISRKLSHIVIVISEGPRKSLFWGRVLTQEVSTGPENSPRRNRLPPPNERTAPSIDDSWARLLL